MQTHAIYLARALASRGYPIEVLTYRAVRHADEEEADQFDEALEFPVRRVLSRLGHFRNLDLLERAARAFQAELVYCSTVFYGDLAERLGVPIISRSVGNDVLRPWIAWPLRLGSRIVSTPWFEDHLYRFFRKLNYPEPIEAIWRRRRRDLMERSARKLTRILANSHFTATLLTEIGVQDDHVEILTGGVAADLFAEPTPDPNLRETLDIPPDRFLMLTACRMVRKKGVDFLIERMENVVEAMPDAHLLLVGSGRHARRFRRAAQRSTVADHITFAGRVPHEQIQAYYALADAFVLASRVQVDPTTGLRDAETMGRVLCEANAAGIPIIAARSGGIPSVIQDGANGLLFEPDNVDSLIETLDRLRTDQGVADHLITTGRQMAKDRFDWSVIVREHERCFKEVLHDVQVHPRPDRAPVQGKVRMVLDPSQESHVSGTAR
jgi:glycosyltransferase involved in cell wall biosynthesis